MSNIDWAEIKQKLPFEKTPEQYKRRSELWDSFDVNGNGILSVAEIDKGLRDAIDCDQLFSKKEVTLRAWHAARDATVSKRKDGLGDDYVERREFRLLLKFLREYFEFAEAFDRVDKDDDNRIELDEFLAAVPAIEKWVGKIKDPEATFKEIDSDGHGMILFDEFCEWAYRHNLDLEDDDDYA